MAAAGLPEADIDAARKHAEERNTFEVWKENWKVTYLFTRLHTQWRVNAMGQMCGLDNAGVLSTMQMRGIPRHRWRRMLNDIQIMEAAVLNYLHEKENKT